MSDNFRSMVDKLPAMKQCDVRLSRCDSMPQYVEARAISKNIQCAKRFRIDSEESVEFIEEQQNSQIINLVSDDEEDTTTVFPGVNNDSIAIRSFSASRLLSSTEIANAGQLTDSKNSIPRPLNHNGNVQNVPPIFGGMSLMTSNSTLPEATTSSHYSTAELDPLSVLNSYFHRHALKQTFDLLMKEDERVRLKTKELAFKLKEKSDSEHNLKHMINEMTSTIDKQKCELTLKDMEIERMKSMVEGLEKVCIKKEHEMIKLVDEQNARVQKAIDETKAKIWCVNCKQEVLDKSLNTPVCSVECLSIVW